MKHAFLILFCCLTSVSRADPWDTLETWPCTYLEKQFLEKIDQTLVHTIVELGGYNGLDAILLHRHYNCPVYTFECDPTRQKEIEERLSLYPDVNLVPMGGWSETGQFPFYIAGHPGASSFFEFNMKTMSEWNCQSIEVLTAPQTGPCHVEPTVVNAIRLDEWIESAGVGSIDLICMDVQGAALEVLKGLGDKLKDVKYVITEVEYKEIYQNEALFPQIRDFMSSHNFQCYYQNEEDYFNNILFVNQDYLSRASK